MTAATTATAGGGAARRGATVACLLLLVGLAFGVRVRLREVRQARHQRVESIDRVLGAREQVAAALLGGFRPVIGTMLWVRVRGLLEQQRVLELPLYLTAIRELQSHSPLVYWTHANWMVLDIPRVLEGREEQRWRWIRDGLAVLEEGRRRFPRHRNILWQGATTYYLRFHPEDQPRDRARFLRDRTLNPEGADPVDIAIDYMEDDLLLDEHEWIEDFFMLTLLETRRLLLEEAAAAGRLPAARAHQGTRALVERGLRLLRHSRASHREDAASVADTVDAAARHFREVLAELEEGFVPGESGPVPPGGAGRSS